MSSPSKQIGLGFSSYGKALNIIFSNGLWWYFLVPVFLNILLIVSGFELKDLLIDSIKNWILDITNLNGSDFFGASIIKSSVSWIVGISLTIILFFVYAYFGGYIILAIMSPVFTLLSEKTETILTGKKFPFNGEQLMRDIVRGVLIVLRNLIIELGLILIVFFIGFLPLIGTLISIISGIVLFFISSYFYGFSFIDYSSERKKLKINKSVAYVRKHKWFAITNGGLFSLTLLLPLCGLSISGFIAIVSVVAASYSVVEMDKQELENPI